MKIVVINGSHRKGNTDFMLDIILKNVDSEVIKLREKSIKFCGGGDNCCPVKLKCHILDEMNEIYSKLEEADLIILASPSYFSNVTARMKNFIDRCNPYYFNKKLKDKKFILIMVGGHEPSVKDGINCMRNFLKGIYAKEIKSYIAVAQKVGELKENKKVIKELENIGKEITKND